jgi:hypothetical protein
LANTPEFAHAQRQRKKVEALFAELKNLIGLRRLRLRRLRFVREQFFLAAAAQNIKRLVRFLSRPTDVTGTWYNGSSVFGATIQLTIKTGKGFFNGSTTISSGDTNIAPVPEPGSLTLVGTGLFGLGGILRRKLKA